MEITVIIPCYNCERYLAETLNSLLAQTNEKWRALVFDDGSADGSLAIAQSFADNDARIKILRHAGGVNKGLAQTIKAAFAHVKTPYVAFLECDDIWQPDYLAAKTAALRANADAKIIFNDVELFGTPARARKLNIYYKAVKLYLQLLNPFKQNYNLVFPLFLFNPIPTFSCVLARAELLKKLNFNPPFAPWLDRWLWLQLCFKNRFYFVDKKLTRWRLHDKSLTMRTLRDIRQNGRAFDKAAEAMYLQNLGLLKYCLIKYCSLALDLGFTLLTLPLRLLIR
ncbi:MAG: glycosyltransferase [Elusimicrobiota bacterium]|jgi:glycosyltransferase involved in cell wall biosynthesis|nr:glycosyltransferase [Elusimicrobiota bacterium]